MDIQCPSCQLHGKINELELPPVGRNLTCPRCQKSFHVEKPPPPEGNRPLMSTCPACQYSTFSDEMFAVCPKCGVCAEDYQVIARKKQEREQAARDQQALTRNFRNPDLVQPPPVEMAGEQEQAPPSVETTARICLVVGAALFVYGILGLRHYYSRDWQAILSEPVLEPVSKAAVFFRLGLIPWCVTLSSLYLGWAAYQLRRLRKDSLRRLSESAWCGVAAAVVYEVVDFCNWARISSGTSTLSYYAVGAVTSLVWAALLSAPFVGLAWYLERGEIASDFRKAGKLRTGL